MSETSAASRSRLLVAFALVYVVWGEELKEVMAFGIGSATAFDAGAGVAENDFGSGDVGVGWVGDGALEGASELLGWQEGEGEDGGCDQFKEHGE